MYDYVNSWLPHLSRNILNLTAESSSTSCCYWEMKGLSLSGKVDDNKLLILRTLGRGYVRTNSPRIGQKPALRNSVFV